MSPAVNGLDSQSRVRSLSSTYWSNPPLKENRSEEEVQKSSGEQSTDKDYRHRVLDFVAGPVPTHDDRRLCECGCERCDENRCQPFFRASQNQLASKCDAFFLLQMAIVANEHNPIASGNPNYGHESD